MIRSAAPIPTTAAVALLLALAGCGGGGGEPPAPLPAVDTSAVVARDPGSALPADWHRGAFMQVFVRSWRDSDGDGHGDLRGLIERLDHLQSLGVTGLWLLPVTPSQDGDHGYAVTDYRAVERAYGSLADFDALLREAHARGIGVIVDHVMNHSAAAHPAFVNARAARDNPFRGWYVWQEPAPAGWNIYGGNPWRQSSTGAYFAPFWDQMPDFDLRNAAVVAWHHDHLRFWLNRGVDGFRFDAVGNLVENGPQAWERQPENYALMRDVRTLLEGYRQRFMVCEAPADPAGFAEACGSAFAFGHQTRMLDAVRGNAAAVQALASHLATASPRLANFLSNHDSFAGARVADQLGGDAARLKLAAATLLLQPGVPFLYYGEEVGMSGGAGLSGDPALRAPMSWTGDPRTAGFTSGTPYRAPAANVATANVAAQQADPDSLLAHYRALLALRKAHAALRDGRAEQAAADGLVLSFQRVLGAERVLVVLNYGDAAEARPAGLPASARLTSVLPADGSVVVADGLGRAVVPMPARSVRVFALGG